MKKVLLLENKAEISKSLIDNLTYQGFKPFKARDILDAQSTIDEEGTMDCYIIDLNVNRDGLNPEQEKRSIHGQITGWIWFNDSVLKVDKLARKKCIIYSDYISILTKNIKSEELRNVNLIGKRTEGIMSVSLEDKISEILNVSDSK